MHRNLINIWHLKFDYTFLTIIFYNILQIVIIIKIKNPLLQKNQINQKDLNKKSYYD